MSVTKLAEHLTKERKKTVLMRSVIDVEDCLTPMQLAELISIIERKAQPEQRTYLEQAFWTWNLLKTTPPQQFQLVQETEATVFYSASPHRASGKSILVCFTGQSHKLMGPRAYYLQKIPAGRFDILLLKDPSLRHYRFGIPGFGDSFIALASEIQEKFQTQSYDNVCCYGTSMGGIPALRMAELIDADCGVGMGCRYPWPVNRLLTEEPAHRTVWGYDPLCHCDRKTEKKLVCIFSEGNQWDKRTADLIRANRPWLIQRPVSNTDHHSPLRQLREQDRLGEFFVQFLADLSCPDSASDQAALRM